MIDNIQNDESYINNFSFARTGVADSKDSYPQMFAMFNVWRLSRLR
jgi:hypothetical protein